MIQQIEIFVEPRVAALEAAAVALQIPPVAAFVVPEAFAVVDAFATPLAVFFAAEPPLAAAAKLPVA